MTASIRIIVKGLPKSLSIIDNEVFVDATVMRLIEELKLAHKISHNIAHLEEDECRKLVALFLQL